LIAAVAQHRALELPIGGNASGPWARGGRHLAADRSDTVTDRD
jgi:hypothetical protein